MLVGFVLGSHRVPGSTIVVLSVRHPTSPLSRAHGVAAHIYRYMTNFEWAQKGISIAKGCAACCHGATLVESGAGHSQSWQAMVLMRSPAGAPKSLNLASRQCPHRLAQCVRQEGFRFADCPAIWIVFVHTLGGFPQWACFLFGAGRVALLIASPNRELERGVRRVLISYPCFGQAPPGMSEPPGAHLRQKVAGCHQCQRLDR